MATIDKYPVGWLLAGSSIAEMNGPYERVERDFSLPLDSHVIVWRNQVRAVIFCFLDTLGI